MQEKNRRIVVSSTCCCSCFGLLLQVFQTMPSSILQREINCNGKSNISGLFPESRISDSILKNSLPIANRVARWVCARFVQSVAQPISGRK
jgi:hypothetical protein